MSPVDVDPETAAEPKRVRSVDAPVAVAPVPAAEITYERQPPSAIPRRWLVTFAGLLLLNIVATTSISWGPWAVRAARDAIAARRAAAAKAQADAAKAAGEAARRQREGALRARAAAFTMPAGQVVYTEDPAEAARLLAELPGYAVVRAPSHSEPPPVRLPHPPLQWDGTPELRDLVHALGAHSRCATVFLHERRAPSGRRLLVWAGIEAARDLHFHNRSDGYFGDIGTDRRLVTHVVGVADDGRTTSWRHVLTFNQPGPRCCGCG